MQQQKHYPPEVYQKQFTRPSCNVYARQFWSHLLATSRADHYYSPIANEQCPIFNDYLPEKWSVSRCEHTVVN